MRARSTSTSLSASRSTSRSRRRSLRPCSRLSMPPRHSRTRSSATAVSPPTRSRSMSASASSRSTSASSATSSPRRAAVSAARARAAAMRCSSSSRSSSSRRQSFSAAAARSRSAARALLASAWRAWAASAAARPEATAAPRSASSRWPSARSISAAASACSVSASRCGRRRPLLLGLGALGVEHHALAVQPRGLVVGSLDLVARGHQLLLGGVDLLVERARLGGGARGGGERLGGLGAHGQQPRLELLLPRRDFLDLAARGEQALHAAAALDHRAAQRLALERDDGHRSLARGQLERVLERRDDDRVGQRGADPLGVGSAHTVEVREQAERLRLLGGDLAQRPAVAAGARGGERQEGAAARALRLQPADPAPRMLGVGHHHGLQPVAQERLDRALVLGAGLERVGHDAHHLDALGTGQQRADALVERRVRRDHLLERGESASEAVPFALQRLDVAGERLGPRPRRVGARAGRVTRARELGRARLGLAAPRARRLAHGGRLLTLALELAGLGARALPGRPPRARRCPTPQPSSSGASRSGRAAPPAPRGPAPGRSRPRPAPPPQRRPRPRPRSSSASAACRSSRSRLSSPRRAASVSPSGATRATSSCSSRAASCARTSVSAICCLQ